MVESRAAVCSAPSRHPRKEDSFRARKMLNRMQKPYEEGSILLDAPQHDTMDELVRARSTQGGMAAAPLRGLIKHLDELRRAAPLPPAAGFKGRVHGNVTHFPFNTGSFFLPVRLAGPRSCVRPGVRNDHLVLFCGPSCGRTSATLCMPHLVFLTS